MVEFEYDRLKSDANRTKHGIDFDEAQHLWSDPNRAEFLARFADESRFGLVAQVGGRLWTAIFTKREHRTRIISVRRSRPNEEAFYHDSEGI